MIGHIFEKISFLSYVIIICKRFIKENPERNGFKTLRELIYIQNLYNFFYPRRLDHVSYILIFHDCQVVIEEFT